MDFHPIELTDREQIQQIVREWDMVIGLLLLAICSKMLASRTLLF